MYLGYYSGLPGYLRRYLLTFGQISRSVSDIYLIWYLPHKYLPGIYFFSHYVNVNVVVSRAQAKASMPASYIQNHITISNIYF